MTVKKEVARLLFLCLSQTASAHHILAANLGYLRFRSDDLKPLGNDLAKKLHLDSRPTEYQGSTGAES
jgi:hypothetical protein